MMQLTRVKAKPVRKGSLSKLDNWLAWTGPFKIYQGISYSSFFWTPYIVFMCTV